MNKYDFRLTPAYCLYNGVAVLSQNGSEINFLMESPENEYVKKQLGRAFENHLEFVQKQEDCPENYLCQAKIAFEPGNHSELKRCVSNYYGKDEIVGKKSEVVKQTKTVEENAAAIILLDSILFEAWKKKATDVHIEDNKVKFRISGKLELQMELHEQRFEELVQRVKLLGEMNVIEKRHGQDGHFVFEAMKNKKVFVRVSTLPVIGKDFEKDNESVVMRILDSERIPLQLEKLGFNSLQLRKISGMLENSNGLILVCGPTGSGKSTTAGALLEKLQQNSNHRLKIISMEDPPEYVLEEVSQVKIDCKIENDFDAVMKQVFRQDPDVLMVGEIRDEISAGIALRGSLTGHLVVATLHTGSVGMALLRMKNLNVDLEMLSSVLRGIILQQLSYIGEQCTLLADVAVPCDSFADFVAGEKSIDGFENYFTHDINSGEVIKESLQILREHIEVKNNQIIDRSGNNFFPQNSFNSKRKYYPYIQQEYVDSALEKDELA